MLFDLRGKRKRAIQVVYAALAVLFAVSFVGFGIGSDAAGGIFDAFGLGSGGGGPSNPQYEDRIEAAEADLAADPKDTDALLELASVYALAGDDEVEVDEQTGSPILTGDARPLYEQSLDAWDRYLALDPRKPDSGIAARVLNVYILLIQSAADAVEIQDLLNGAVRSATVLAEDQPSANSYGTLAEFAYLAGKEDQGDEAATLAVDEAEPSERKQIEQFTEDARKQGEALQKQIEEQREASATSPEEAFQNPLEESPGGGLTAPPPAP